MTDFKPLTRGQGMNKIKFCPLLTGQVEVKALMIGQGDYVIPTFNVCLQEHCAAFAEKPGGEKWCNHYNSSVEYRGESEK